MEELFEIEYEDTFQAVVKKSSIDVCMGALYTKSELYQMFNNGEVIGDYQEKESESSETIFQSTNWINWTDPFHVYIKAGNVIHEIFKQFQDKPKLKVASVGFENNHITMVVGLNWWFKQKGYMYSPAKGGFVKWKQPVVKKTKQKLSKAVLLGLKRRTIDLIGRYLRSTYKIDIYMSGTDGEKMYNVLKLGLVHGLDLKYFLTLPRFGSDYGNFFDLESYIKFQLTQYKNQEGMEKQTLEAYKEWFNQVYTVEIK